MYSKPTITIIFFGRTGSGKTSLCQKSSGKNFGQIGNTLFSTTSTIEDQIVEYNNYKVRFVDTPGFADNRGDLDNPKILVQLINYVKSLKDGITLGLYCIPGSKMRLDEYDLNEIQMIGAVFGTGIFDHLSIAVTQLDSLGDSFKTQAKNRFKNDLPGLLQTSGFTTLSGNQIFYSDFSAFNDFNNQLHSLVEKISPYQPNLQNVDPQTVLLSSGVKNVLDNFKRIAQEQEKKLREEKEEVKRQEDLKQQRDNEIRQEQARQAEIQRQVLQAQQEAERKKSKPIEQKIINEVIVKPVNNIIVKPLKKLFKW